MDQNKQKLSHWLLSVLPHDLRRSLLFSFRVGLQRHAEQLRYGARADYSIAPMLAHNAMFIHVPKCAGLSLCESLFGCMGPGHIPHRHYQLYYSRSEYQSAFKFTFVRNPWDRLYSAYTFLRAGGISRYDAEFSQKIMISYSTFEEFVLAGLNDPRVTECLHFKTQVSYLQRFDGAIGLDFIGHFENLAEDYGKVRSRLNCGNSLPHKNKTYRKGALNYRDHYNLEMIEMVRQKYQSDVKLLNYEY